MILIDETYNLQKIIRRVIGEGIVVKNFYEEIYGGGKKFFDDNRFDRMHI